MWKEPLLSAPQMNEMKMTAMGLFLAIEAIMTPSQPRLVAKPGAELAEGAHHFGAAAHARDEPAEQEDRQEGALVVDAAELGKLEVLADHLELVPLDGVLVEQVHQDRDADGDEDRRRRARARQEHRQARGRLHVRGGDRVGQLGRVEAHVLEGQVLGEEQRRIVEHQGADQLVDVEQQLEDGGDEGEDHAAEPRHQQADDDMYPAGHEQLVADDRRDERAEIHLPLDAHVPDARFEGDDGGDAGDDARGMAQRIVVPIALTLPNAPTPSALNRPPPAVALGEVMSIR